ncbi:MAG: acyl-CoA reductase [Promethearchaeota archaeon]
MSVQVFLYDNTFYEVGQKKIVKLKIIKEKIEKNREILKKIPIDDILDVFQAYSRELIHNSTVNRIEGVAFLANWLRKINLKKVLNNNLGSIEYLNYFVGDGRKKIKAQPRGLVCHWIAGNIPTLGLFSLVQSILVRNSNILRIPEVSQAPFLSLLRVLANIQTPKLNGYDLLKTVAIIYFPSSDVSINNEFSSIADVRVVWGGEDAVDAITRAKKLSHCEDVVFGPKYSFAVIDKEAQESPDLPKIIRNLVIDIVLFEQSACSSPQVLFFEQENLSLYQIAEIMAKEFQNASKRFPKIVDQYTATKIIKKRAEYALSLDKHLIFSKANDWTILIDNQLQLEEPVQSRTIFMKPINSVLDVIPLITKKIQTIGVAIYNQTKLLEFTDAATYKGVARCVIPGQMNVYDSPWDGIYLLNRLVRWTTLYT